MTKANYWEKKIGGVRMYVRPSDTGHGVCVYVVTNGVRKEAHWEGGTGAAKRAIKWIKARLNALPEGLSCNNIQLSHQAKSCRDAAARRQGIRVHK